MKKFMTFILQIVLSAALSAGVNLIGFAILGIRDMAMFLWSYLMVSILIALFMGAFDVKEKQSKYNSIKHRMGRRNYGQAAIFVGTAAIFIGTPQECEELADSMQHYAQQAHVQVLDGNETFDIL